METISQQSHTTTQNQQGAGDVVVGFILLGVLAIGFIWENLVKKRRQRAAALHVETERHAERRKAA